MASKIMYHSCSLDYSRANSSKCKTYRSRFKSSTLFTSKSRLRGWSGKIVLLPLQCLPHQYPCGQKLSNGQIEVQEAIQEHVMKEIVLSLLGESGAT